jgi:glycosyltransferase involved in cell wall biosynthesis
MKREMEAQGHRVSIFTGEIDPSAPREPGVYAVRRRPFDRVLRRLPWRAAPDGDDIFAFSEVIAAEMLRLHRRDPIDVIEMEESFGWFAEVGRLTSIPVLVKLHGPAFLSLVENELDTPFGREKIEREGRALALTSTIVSPSQLTLKQTIERYELKAGKTQRIVNPLTMEDDTPLWSLDACDRKAILFVGRFDLRKGADIVLKAFSLLLTSQPDLKLIFVGPDHGLPGPNGIHLKFGPYRDLLFAKEFKDHVDFRGRMPNREVARLRAQSMVTVVASRWENQGYTVLEAMFQGCPLVSTDAGGCPESVIHGVTGRLAKSEDPKDFAAQLRAMLEDPRAAELMGREARRHVIEQHSATRVAAETLEMYRDIIGSRGPNAAIGP